MLRLLGWLFGFGVFCALAGVAAGGVYLAQLSDKLPDYTVLKDYQPPVTTRVHAADGTLLAEYARERRLFQPIETIPQTLIQAFLSAEDKDFYKHGGIDFFGVVRAVRDNVMRRAEGGEGPLVSLDHHAAGGQNFLLHSTRPGTARSRKRSWRSDRVDILEGQDPRALSQRDLPGLGGRADLRRRRRRTQLLRQGAYELTLSESAYIAALPKAPSNYHPFRYRRLRSNAGTGCSIACWRMATSSPTRRPPPKPKA